MSVEWRRVLLQMQSRTHLTGETCEWRSAIIQKEYPTGLKTMNDHQRKNPTLVHAIYRATDNPGNRLGLGCGSLLVLFDPQDPCNFCFKSLVFDVETKCVAVVGHAASRGCREVRDAHLELAVSWGRGEDRVCPGRRKVLRKAASLAAFWPGSLSIMVVVAGSCSATVNLGGGRRYSR